MRIHLPEHQHRRLGRTFERWSVVHGLGAHPKILDWFDKFTTKEMKTHAHNVFWKSFARCSSIEWSACNLSTWSARTLSTSLVSLQVSRSSSQYNCIVCSSHWINNTRCPIHRIDIKQLEKDNTSIKRAIKMSDTKTIYKLYCSIQIRIVSIQSLYRNKLTVTWLAKGLECWPDECQN